MKILSLDAGARAYSWVTRGNRRITVRALPSPPPDAGKTGGCVDAARRGGSEERPADSERSTVAADVSSWSRARGNPATGCSTLSVTVAARRHEHRVARARTTQTRGHTDDAHVKNKQ